MVISHNLQALNAQRQLNITTDLKAKAMEKLSSGYRINRAADDAAGLAISEKMRSQIRGLNRAAANVQDGINFCQVADGAMVEMDSMVHRMRELSVQAANGTLTNKDRSHINDEFEQLIEEIDKIVEDTEFNTLPVFSTHVSDGPPSSIKYTTTKVPATPENLQNATHLSKVLGSAKVTAPGLLTGSYPISTNMVTSSTAYITSTPSARHAAKIDFGGFGTSYSANELYGCGMSTTCAHGCGVSYNIVFTDEKKPKTINGVNFGFTDDSKTKTIELNISEYKTGAQLTNAIVTAAKNCPSFINHRHQVAYDPASPSVLYLYDNTAIAAGLYPSYNDFALSPDGKVVLRVPKDEETEEEIPAGDLWIQSGANEGNGFYIDYPYISLERLKLTGTNILTQKNAQNAISTLDEALGVINKERSMIGASQNRCEHAFAIDNITGENLQAAESQLRDADMASEVVTNAKLNILQQVGESMLSQSNKSKEGILSLLSM